MFTSWRQSRPSSSTYIVASLRSAVTSIGLHSAGAHAAGGGVARAESGVLSPGGRARAAGSAGARLRGLRGALAEEHPRTGQAPPGRVHAPVLGPCFMSIHSLHIATVVQPAWPWNAEIREPVDSYFVYILFSIGHQHVERPVKGLMSIMLHEMMCAERSRDFVLHVTQ